MSQSPDLSVVVPLLNEEESLPELTQWIHRVASDTGLSCEVVFVDDGSTDGSWAVIQSLKKTYPGIRALKFRRNYGKSAALHEGFQLAQGRVVITMDADLQDSPDEIPELYCMITEEGYDLVSGWKKKRYDPISKTIPTKLYNAVTRSISGIKLHDFNCGLKAYRRDVVKNIEVYGEMHRYITLLAYLNGARITEVKVKHHQRQFGKSKYGLGRTTKVINDLILLLFQRKYLQKPIHLFGNIGLLCFATGSVILMYLLISKFGFGQDIGNRPLLILGILLMFVGVQFFTTGFIIDLQMRTYFESQQKRPYKIRKIFIGESELKKEHSHRI